MKRGASALAPAAWKVMAAATAKVAAATLRTADRGVADRSKSDRGMFGWLSGPERHRYGLRALAPTPLNARPYSQRAGLRCGSAETGSRTLHSASPPYHSRSAPPAALLE